MTAATHSASDGEPRSAALIRDLVAFPTVSREPNRDIVAYIAEWFERHNVDTEIIWNDEGTKANLWATVGPADQPGVVLSGHTDVVPVDGQEWTADPFAVHHADGRLYGRGTCDMKGFVAVILSFLPEMLARNLAAPVHFALSYDEELGCKGVGSLIDHINRRAVTPAVCIVGEPTEMEVIIGHKGGRCYRVSVHGATAHSSLAPQAVNAISYAAELIAFLDGIAAEWQTQGPFDDAYDVTHSTLSVNLIEAGTALNIVPDLCTFLFEFRHLDAVDPQAVYERIKRHAEILQRRMRAVCKEAHISFEEVFDFKSLGMEPGHAAAGFVKSLVGANSDGKVAFGTEAGYFHKEAGIPTIVCGPGSIAQAHKADEFIEESELLRCEAMMSRLLDRLERGGTGLY